MKMSGMSVRESVIAIDMINLDDGRTFIITKAIEHPDYPITKKMIRVDVYTAGHCYQDGDDTRYLEFAYFDMKGWFPTRLMNMLIGSMASEQLK